MRSGSVHNRNRIIMAANSFSSSRKRPYGTTLLLALVAALLCVVALHNMRERRVFSILLHDRDRQVLAMQLLVETERQNLNEMKRRLVGLKMKISSLATQKSELHKQLMEAAAKAAHADEIQREKETGIAEKQNEIDALAVKQTQPDNADLRVSNLTELLKQKIAEVDELRLRLVHQESNVSIRNSEERAPSLEETKEEATESNPDEEMNREEENNGSQKGQLVKLTTNVDNMDMKDSKENDNKQSENVEQMSYENQNTSLNGSDSRDTSAETKGEETNAKTLHKTRTRRKHRRKRIVAKQAEEKKNQESGNKEDSQMVQAGEDVERESMFTEALEDTKEATLANNYSANGDISKQNLQQKQTGIDEGKQQDSTTKPTVSRDYLQKAENTSDEDISNNLQEHSFSLSNEDTEKGVKSEETDLQNKASESEKEVTNVTDKNNNNALQDSSTGSADAASKSNEAAAKDTATDQHSEM